MSNNDQGSPELLQGKIPGEQEVPRTVVQLAPEVFQQVWDTNLRPLIDSMMKSERFDMAMGCLLAAQAMVQHPNINSTVQIANMLGTIKGHMLAKTFRGQEEIVAKAGFTPEVAKAMIEYVEKYGQPGNTVQ